MLQDSKFATSSIVGVVATVTDTKRMHHTLRPNHGQHEFQFIEILKKPDKVKKTLSYS